MDQETLATKIDVDNVRTEVNNVRIELRGEIAELRGETASLGSALRGEMAELRGDLKSEMASNMRVMVLTQLTTTIAMMGVVIGFA